MNAHRSLTAITDLITLAAAALFYCCCFCWWWCIFLGRWIWLNFSQNSKNWSWTLGFGLKPRISFALTIVWKHLDFLSVSLVMNLMWSVVVAERARKQQQLRKANEQSGRTRCVLTLWSNFAYSFLLFLSISHTHTISCTHTVYCTVDRLLLFRCTCALILPLSPTPRLFRLCVRVSFCGAYSNSRPWSRAKYLKNLSLSQTNSVVYLFRCWSQRTSNTTRILIVFLFLFFAIRK